MSDKTVHGMTDEEKAKEKAEMQERMDEFLATIRERAKDREENAKMNPLTARWNK